MKDTIMYIEIAAVVCVIVIIPLRILSLDHQWTCASFAYFFTTVIGFKFTAITK